MKKVILALFILSYFIFPASQVESAGLSLGVYPPVIQIDTQAPASIKTPITLENNGDETVQLTPFFKPFKAADSEDGQAQYLSGKEFQGEDPLIFQRMQIMENGHVIKKTALSPGQKKQLELHIGLPKDEPHSDYYFSITFLTQEQSKTDEMNKTQAVGGIGPVVLLSIGPKGKTKGEIAEFSAPAFLEKGPVPFTVRVKNTSKHFITPNGTILIKNVFGQIIGKVDLLPVNILGNSIRAIPSEDRKQTTDSLAKQDLASPDRKPESASRRTENPDSVLSGLPTATWNEAFLLGPYTATLTIALSEQGPLFTKTIYFFGFPAQGLIALIVAAIIVLIIRSRIKSKINE